MALSEGFRGFVDMLKGTFSPDEGIDEGDAFTFDQDYPVEDNLARKPQEGIDDIYPTTTAPSGFTRRFGGRKENTNVAPMPGYASNEVMVIEPRSFSESAQIVKQLKDKKTIILHLDLLDKEQSQRTIDFVCGASHALDGSVQKISETVVIFAPHNVSLKMETAITQSKFSESLWNKPATL